MTREEIAELFERLGRLVAATKRLAGDGTTWDHTFSNGHTQRYVIRGLKSPAEVKDSACNLVLWIWNARDYLKNRAKSLGRDVKEVEKAMSDDHDVVICADLAERLKHSGSPRNSRSGLAPRLGKVSFQAPQTAISSLSFQAREIEISIEDPSQVACLLPVLDEAGKEIGDAFVCAQRALLSLERIRDAIEAVV
jgi:hypothetical protein